MISVVIPTISGREESLQRTLDAYVANTVHESEIIVIKDAPTWPGACNAGYRKANGSIIHFTADDLTPFPEWDKDILSILENDELPAPRVHDYRPDGKFMNSKDGKDGELTHFTRVPIMTRDQFQRIGFWPEIVYYADIWVSEKARTVGIKTRMLYSYAFVHHWCQVGRVDSKENLDTAGGQLNTLRRQMGIRHRS